MESETTKLGVISSSGELSLDEDLNVAIVGSGWFYYYDYSDDADDTDDENESNNFQHGDFFFCEEEYYENLRYRN